MSSRIYFLLFLLIVRRVIASNDGCKLMRRNRRIINCNSITLAQLPSLDPKVPKSRLTIKNSNFSTISTSTFGQYKNRLESLELTNDKIKHILPGTFSMWTELQWLTLDSNELEVIPTKVFNEGLKKLSLGSNHIRHIDSDALSHVNKLSRLNLRHNLITTVQREAFKLPKLSDLNLSFNNISSIDKDAFLGLPRLRLLFLENNNIQKLDPGAFRDLGSLVVLKLSHNKIEKILEGTFDKLKKLQFLFLSNNKLKTLERYYFKSLTSLVKLDVSFNSISKYDQDTFKLPNLKKLSLNGNKISIDKDDFKGIHLLD